MTPLWVTVIHKGIDETGITSGPKAKAWYKSAKRWWTGYLKKIGATDFEFHPNHYEFSGFFKRNEQWWYISSGDARYNIMNGLLVRKASGPKDFTGGLNKFVGYDERFELNLNNILFDSSDGVMTKLTGRAGIIRPEW